MTDLDRYLTERATSSEIRKLLRQGSEVYNGWILDGRYWVRITDGKRIFVIAGGGPANTVQNDKYAFGTDDGSESGHSLDSENTNRTAQAADVTFLIRIQVEETAGGVDNLTAALYAQKNGSGGFLAVPYSATNNGLRLADDTQSRADDELTTQRLSYGGGTLFRQGRYDDGTSAVGTSAVALDQDNNGVTDFEFAIQIDSANASNSDYWELRVEWTGGADLDGYPGSYPTVTASIAVTPEIEESDGLTLGESLSVSALVLGDVAELDGLTVGDTVVDISVTGGGEPDNEVDEADGLTVGESITAKMSDMTASESDGLTLGESLTVQMSVMEVSESDGLTLGESITVQMDDMTVSKSDGLTVADVIDNVTVQAEEPPIEINIAMDNLAYWVQGVKVSG